MNSDIASRIMRRVKGHGRGGKVFCAKDFLDFGSRAAVDQALSRLTKSGQLRRMGRGLYDWPLMSSFVKGKVLPPDVNATLKAVARKNGITLLPSGIASANSLGLTNAVSVQPDFITDGPGRSIVVGQVKARLKHGGKKLLAWRNRPAFPVVNALFWLGEDVATRSDVSDILKRSLSPRVKQDLRKGISLLPRWAAKIAQDIVGVS